uniref:Centromere protein O n=1 Tax=Crassostrea virginica TaxID=6565 RepID=A0A8B8A6W9_CRAVI|nr:centromere protein O-like [Crassostrea virginica]
MRKRRQIQDIQEMSDSFTFLEKLEHEKENTEGNKNDPFHKWIQLKSTREKLLTKLEHLERTERELNEEIETELKNRKSEGQNKELHDRHQYLEELLSVYRITGTHVCEEGRNQFTVCLDAAYYDTVLDSYLIEFQMRDDGYFIQRHSLPEFIPTLTLEKEYLSGGDISLFLSVIRNYLQAYVFKREEIARVKEFTSESGLSCAVKYTSSYDFAEIKLEYSKQNYNIKLSYGLLSVLPEKVKIEEDSETQRGIVEWKSLLLSKPLYDSFSEIVKDILK